MEPEARQKPIRYYEIDLLRFLAALAVVLYHFTYRGFHADHLSPVEYPRLGAFFKYGHLGVELFFIISGYVVLLSAQGKTVSQFFISRVTRLYPAYWVACTLTFGVVWLLGPAPQEAGWSPILAASARDYLPNMLMLNSFMGYKEVDGVYWTLAVELLFYFWIAVAIAFGWLRHLPLVLAIWLGYAAIAGTGYGKGIFMLVLFPRFAPFFIAGMVFYLLQTRQGRRWQLYALLAAAFALSMRSGKTVALEYSTLFQDSFSVPVVCGTIAGFFGLFLLIAYRKFQLPGRAWLAWAGALTYPIYLLHHNVGYVALQRLGPSTNKYVLLVGLLLAVGALAYGLHTLVERRYSKPLGHYLQRLLARLGQPQAVEAKA
jgi:peptidoglycan/LPS O-acetylase OafA/YrhL